MSDERRKQLKLNQPVEPAPWLKEWNLDGHRRETRARVVLPDERRFAVFQIHQIPGRKPAARKMSEAMEFSAACAKLQQLEKTFSVLDYVFQIRNLDGSPLTRAQQKELLPEAAEPEPVPEPVKPDANAILCEIAQLLKRYAR